MQLAMIGLGRMGGNMVLQAPRVVWVMVPAGAPTQATIDDLAGRLSKGRWPRPTVTPTSAPPARATS